MLYKPLDLPYEHSEYEGIPIVKIIPPGRYKEICESHQSRSDDVYIATYPKSGTTWLQHIINQMLGEPRGKDKTIFDAIPWLPVETQNFIDNLSSPRFLKTHMKWQWVPKGDGVKYIYCYRNPKDVAVSYYFHTQNFKHFGYVATFDEYFRDVFMSNKAATYGSYFDHVAAWLQHKDNPNILFLTYEDLVEDLLREINRIEKFLGLNVGEEMKLKITGNSTFSSMKNNNQSNYSWIVGTYTNENTFLRKGKVGDWVDHLSEEQSNEIESRVNEKLIPLGAKMRYCLQ